VATKNASRADDAVNEDLNDSVASAVKNDNTFTDAQLRSVDSFEAALALASQEYGDVLDAADEIGSGFVNLDNKDRLIDTTFLILSFAISEGDFRGDDGFLQHFASVRVVTRAGEKFWFTDGGTGIYRQLEDLAVRSGRKGGILVNNGLRKSEYEFEDSKGNMQPGVTYYLNV
jgi:hypothetical protein